MTKLTAARIVCYLITLLATPFLWFGAYLTWRGPSHDRVEGMLLLAACLPVVTVMMLLAHRWLPRSRWFGYVSRNAFNCPTCGYNMAGLSATKCPECGAEFTIDQLRRA